MRKEEENRVVRLGCRYVASTNERQLRVQSLVDKAVFKSSHCVQLQCIYRVWVSRYP